MALPKIETPRYELTVPSTGQKVEYRPYLVKEEKSLMIAMEDGKNSTMLNTLVSIIDSCTFGKLSGEKDISRELALFDIEYIFLRLRSVSTGEISNVSMACQTKSCDSSVEIRVNLDEVELDGQVASEEDRLFQINDDIGVKLRYPTVRDILKIGDGKTTDEYTSLINMLVASISSIYTDDEVFAAEDHTTSELVDFVESMSEKQLQRLTAFYQSMPALRKTYEAKCSSCGHTHKYTLEGLQNFF